MIPLNFHKFSRAFAKTHGDTMAVLLKHLAHKVQDAEKHARPKNYHEGKYWHFNSAAKLQKKVPYLSESTISATVKKAKSVELLEIGNFNKRKADRTQWYHVPPEQWEPLETDLIKFDVDAAKEHGILAAVLHQNLYNFLKKQVKKKVTDPAHEMSPVKLVDYLPYSSSAISKALARMVKSGLIIKTDGRAKYTFPEADLIVMRRMW